MQIEMNTNTFECVILLSKTIGDKVHLYFQHDFSEIDIVIMGTHIF